MHSPSDGGLRRYNGIDDIIMESTVVVVRSPRLSNRQEFAGVKRTSRRRSNNNYRIRFTISPSDFESDIKMEEKYDVIQGKRVHVTVCGELKRGSREIQMVWTFYRHRTSTYYYTYFKFTEIMLCWERFWTFQLSFFDIFYIEMFISGNCTFEIRIIFLA